jgi:tripartite ATP-independent transporter DctP family solute receptor
LSSPIPIKMGGYGPPTTGFSKSLKLIGDKLTAQFGSRVDVSYVFNIMDHGRKAEDILTMVEHGELTMGYQSSSYLTDRVPELGFVDLPFLFSSNAQARAAMDGALGQFLVRKTEERINYRILGWFENGFRHISNRLRPIHLPADMKGMKIRVLPSEIHRRTFELIGATPMRMDLTEAIAMVKAGTLDAQENPLANTVTYGVHKFHKFHTLTNHFYISRPIFFHRTTFDVWPKDLQDAMQKAVTETVTRQRQFAEEEHEQSKQAIEAAGCVFNALTGAEHDAFVAAVQPLLNDARKMYGEATFRLVPKA